MPGTRCLVITMATEPAPPGGTVRHAWLFVAQWEPEKRQKKSKNETGELKKNKELDDNGTCITTSVYRR